MSDVGRYRKIYTHLWRDRRFVALSEGEKLDTLYSLSGPQMNRIGLTHFSLSTAAEDRGTLLNTFTKRFRNVCATFQWHYDGTARVLFIPSWFTYNKPENANVLKGILNDLADVPDCQLIAEFAANLQTLPETLWETFAERCTKRLGKRSPIQEPEQEPEQELEPEPTRARARTRGSNVRADGNCHENVRPELIALARQTVKTAGDVDDLAYLCDALGSLNCLSPRPVAFTRAEALAALNAVLLERRASVS